jgi:drug/metabolite transporter (DMT)-like permease
LPAQHLHLHGNAWHLPPEALWAIGYSVIFQTIIGYCAQAWALRYAESSLVALYATMQPVSATAISCMVLSFGWSPPGVLAWPGREMSGAVLIIIGLMVTVPRNSSAKTGSKASIEESLLAADTA